MDYMAPRINYQSLLVGQETESRSASYQITRICFNACIEIKEVWLEYSSCHFQASLDVLPEWFCTLEKKCSFLGG